MLKLYLQERKVPHCVKQLLNFMLLLALVLDSVFFSIINLGLILLSR